MKIRTKFILSITIVFFCGIMTYAILSDIIDSRQYIKNERNYWISRGYELADIWYTTMLLTGSDNLAKDQFYQGKYSLEVNRYLVRNPKLNRINNDSSPYASKNLELKVIDTSNPTNQIIKTDSVKILQTLVPLIGNKVECINCHRKVNHHDVKLGDVFGVIVLESSLEHMSAQARSSRTFNIITILIILAVSVVIIYVLTGQVTLPIVKLAEKAKMIASGNYDIEVNVEGYGEIKTLKESFNRMAKALFVRNRQYKEQQQVLETRVKERTQELQEEKEKLSVIVENVPSSFVLLGADLHIRLKSPGIQRLLGENSGKTDLDDFSNDSNLTEICDLLLAQKAIKTKTIQSDILELTTAESETKLIERLYVPIIHENISTGLILIVTDITRKQQLQTQLIQAEKMEAVGGMSAVLAHEMRNSITSVKMLTQLVLEAHHDDEHKESLNVAIQSLNKMEMLVANLLRFAKPRPLEMSTIEPEELLKSLETLGQHLHKRNGHGVTISIEKNLPNLELDVDYFREALVNLILNAGEACIEDGEINIRVGRKELEENLEDYDTWQWPTKSGNGINRSSGIILACESEVCLITVSDNGPGMSNSSLSKVFDPFFTTKANGTGLGLSFVKRIVNAHGGVVRSENIDGGGARFFIYIPWST